MIVDLTLPRLGETMETGRIAAWLKQPGDAFRRGETLVEIESDKTVVEMPALGDGVVVEIVMAAGQDADVGAVLCRYEDGLTAQPATLMPEPAQTPPQPAPEPLPNAALPAAASGDRGSLRATPLARAVARQHGIALADVIGSGRRGRIQAADVRAARPPALGPASPVGAVLHGFDLPEGRIAYRTWGPDAAASARIVLLHGLAADVQSWASLAAALARAGRTVIAADLPGHGATSIETGDIETAAAAATAFLERLGGDPVELVGHSLGGAVAARAARRAPGRVRRLTLLAPAGLDRGIDVEFVRGIARVRAAGALQHLLRRLTVRPAALTPAQLDALALELSRGRLIRLADALVDDGGQQIDITGDLRAAAMPARVVWGVQDRIIPWTQVSQAGSRTAVHLIQDAGHVPHWDQPAEVAALFG
jgi:pyruvate dehydrogenase E2 component (dihydrolipoamide acetyltransferase)